MLTVLVAANLNHRPVRTVLSISLIAVPVTLGRMFTHVLPHLANSRNMC